MDAEFGANFQNGTTTAAIFNTPYCRELLMDWKIGGTVGVFDLLLCLPSVMFLIFLLAKLRSSIRKLLETESLIMSTYYGFLWFVCLFNIGRSLLNYFFPNPPVLYYLLFLITNFVLVFIEVSVVVFMSHGYMVSGREAITRTIWITLIIGVIYTMIQAIMIFGLHVQLFKPVEKPVMLYWVLISFLFTGMYLVILILPKTRFKDKLPARPSFYHYVGFLFALYLVKGIGDLIVFVNVGIGYCFIDLGIFGYYALYAPMLYIFFLQEFFRDVILSDGYVEMEKSGYLDTDT